MTRRILGGYAAAALGVVLCAVTAISNAWFGEPPPKQWERPGPLARAMGVNPLPPPVNYDDYPGQLRVGLPGAEACEQGDCMHVGYHEFEGGRWYEAFRWALIMSLGMTIFGAVGWIFHRIDPEKAVVPEPTAMSTAVLFGEITFVAIVLALCRPDGWQLLPAYYVFVTGAVLAAGGAGFVVYQRDRNLAADEPPPTASPTA